MRIQKVGITPLLLLLLSGCAGIGTASPEKTEEDALSIAALFQTENGDTLNGSAACFTTGPTANIAKWTAKEWPASPACRGAANCC